MRVDHASVDDDVAMATPSASSAAAGNQLADRPKPLVPNHIKVSLWEREGGVG